MITFSAYRVEQIVGAISSSKYRLRMSDFIVSDVCEFKWAETCKVVRETYAEYVNGDFRHPVALLIKVLNAEVVSLRDFRAV